MSQILQKPFMDGPLGHIVCFRLVFDWQYFDWPWPVLDWVEPWN